MGAHKVNRTEHELKISGSFISWSTSTSSRHCQNCHGFRGVFLTRRASNIKVRKRYFLECSLGLVQWSHASVSVIQSCLLFIIDHRTLEFLRVLFGIQICCKQFEMRSMVFYPGKTGKKCPCCKCTH